jgi:alanine dehydrogenase
MEETIMNVGIPRERFMDERRVALSPAGVRGVVEAGGNVFIEQHAGEEAGWQDAEYQKAGANVVFSREEAIGRADLLLKVLPPNEGESELLRDNQIVMSYLQLPLARKSVFQNMVERKITAIGLENIYYEGGGHPIRRAMSEIAGSLSIHVAARYLNADSGGRGVLMGGVPGVPPASIGIIGAGVVGTTAAETALNMGAHVFLLDHKVAPLRSAVQHFGKRLHTAVITESSIEKISEFVDVLIGCVLVEDAATPHLVSREQVRNMKNRSVAIDVAIDQGGTFETSRPTTLSSPTFIDEGVIHYAVPNMPSKVARTSTRAFQNQVLPLVVDVVRNGAKKALSEHSYLSSGLNMFEGIVTRSTVGAAFGVETTSVSEVLK